MFSERIVTLSKKVASKELTPDEVPVYDRNLVQEYLLSSWLGKVKKCSGSHNKVQVINT